MILLSLAKKQITLAEDSDIIKNFKSDNIGKGFWSHWLIILITLAEKSDNIG